MLDCANVGLQHVIGLVHQDVAQANVTPTTAIVSKGKIGTVLLQRMLFHGQLEET
jgi:hypothetical protein